jgi:urease accessory protein
MGWHGHLNLHYSRNGERTIALDRHTGPLRVLQRLYPEGPGICHHVLVHPPGGVVGGDTLTIAAQLDADTHAVVTTPGATRFYRSNGLPALQQAHLQLAAGARLEWLPLEAIAHPGCQADNRVVLDLAPGAESIGWDLLALGLPAADDPFDRGSFLQHLELTGQWLDRGRVHGSDTRLLDSPLGWAGRRVLGTLWFAAGQALDPARREGLLDSARLVVAGDALVWGATTPAPTVVVVRALASQVEPLMALFVAVRAAWRMAAWQLPAAPPRIWRT